MPDSASKRFAETGSVPVPDPTVLTTQQLLREIATSREVVEVMIAGIKSTIETRLNAMDKAIELLHESNSQLPKQLTREVIQLRQLHDEKFKSIATQFAERDTRTEQTSRDSKVAVDAALQAAKEAVGEQNNSNALAISKSEATFTKQIDQIGVLVSTMGKGFDDKIDDMKSRLQTIEAVKQGITEQRQTSNDSWGYIIGVGGLIIAGAAIVVSIIIALVLHK